MNFDQLQKLWNNDNPEIEVSINKDVINEFTAIKLQDGLKEIKWNAIIEITINSLWIIFLIGFSIDHAEHYIFLIPAIMLLVIAIFSIILEAYKLKLFFSIKYQFSIAKAQTHIEKLNFLEILDLNSLHLIIPLFFVPFIIVVSKGFLGIDLFHLGLELKEILLATLGSLIIAIISTYLLKKFSLQRLKDSVEFLKDLRDLKRE